MQREHPSSTNAAHHPERSMETRASNPSFAQDSATALHAALPGISLERYAKQILLSPIGLQGQQKIMHSHVTVIGVGALGTVIATQLCRAGVGQLRLVDRDVVELSNLQRQVLFDEEDCRQRLPKAVAAASKLHACNSQVDIATQVADVTPRNVEELLAGSDLVLDGTDNLETRFLLNDTCVKLGIPWVYGGALGAIGCSMTIVPGQTACLNCLLEQMPAPGTTPTCDTVGVLAAATGAVASLECAQALWLLAGNAPRSDVVYLDLWEHEFLTLHVDRRADCPTCVQHKYDYLLGQGVAWTTVLCGRNSVQIVPPGEHELDLRELKQQLQALGQASFNGFTLNFRTGEYELVIFPTGRVIVKGTTDETVARTLYARFLGT